MCIHHMKSISLNTQTCFEIVNIGYTGHIRELPHMKAERGVICNGIKTMTWMMQAMERLALEFISFTVVNGENTWSRVCDVSVEASNGCGYALGE